MASEASVGLLISPFVLQAAAMAVDELHFHRARGLGAWESWGHPIDTAAMAAALAWVRFTPPGEAAFRVFLALAALSCLIITKDEWVHRRECAPAESWLHAVLFMLHPVALLSAALLWPGAHGIGPHAGWAGAFLTAQLGMVGAFGAYQLIYWRGPWSRRR